MISKCCAVKLLLNPCFKGDVLLHHNILVFSELVFPCEFYCVANFGFLENYEPEIIPITIIADSGVFCLGELHGLLQHHVEVLF